LKVAQLQGNQVKSDKTLVPHQGKCTEKLTHRPTPAEKFELPFEGKLSQDNRWVIMANLIPWDEFEEEYAQNFCRRYRGTSPTVSDSIGFINNQRED
jgi:hypothetical protein